MSAPAKAQLDVLEAIASHRGVVTVRADASGARRSPSFGDLLVNLGTARALERRGLLSVYGSGFSGRRATITADGQELVDRLRREREEAES